MIRRLLLTVLVPVAGAFAQTSSPDVPAAFSIDEEVRLAASDGAPEDQFGFSVALDGDRALVGAFNANEAAGAVYVFVRTGGVWVEEAKLTASDAAPGSFFGGSVALDGERALIGAFGDESTTGGPAGAAYIFIHSGGTWVEEAKLVASDAATGDSFGSSVSLDGDRGLISAVGDANAAGEDAGSAYVFVRSGSTWVEEAKLTASDAEANDFFGSGSISGDLILIGAPGPNDDLRSGAAYVFRRSGETWIEEVVLTASDGTAGDGFGLRVSLDGERALIGACCAAGETGSAYVFTRSEGTWVEEMRLTAGDGEVGDSFGARVSLDGGRAIVGAPTDDEIGSAYVFVRSGNVWTEEEKLTASGGAAGDGFGVAVALDGTSALVGAFRSDTDAGANAGTAHGFGLTTVANEDVPSVRRLRLNAPFPNPVRDRATVCYTLDTPGEVYLALFDVLGREVAVLAAGARAAGTHEAQLAMLDLPAGLYVLRLTAGAERAVRKVLLVE